MQETEVKPIGYIGDQNYKKVALLLEISKEKNGKAEEKLNILTSVLAPGEVDR